ncbi:MAG: LuxR C-terminal-related transcriptional regulator [Raoultibacter sp.]
MILRMETIVEVSLHRSSVEGVGKVLEIAFYFYTILLLLVCIAAGVTALSAYFVSRKKMFLLAMLFFLFYFFDLAIIFQSEYLAQNLSFSPDSFYLIEHPYLKTIFTLGTLEAVWLIVCDALDVKNRRLAITPAVVFFVASLSVLWFYPESQEQQWLYYSLRQVFLLWCLGYAFFCYTSATDGAYKSRLRRYRYLYLASTLLILCIFAEDSFMILGWKPDFIASLFPLYLSERNFSENILMLFWAALTLRAARETLALRFQKPPTSENPTLQKHIDELLPRYCERQNLTAREKDILELILLGKDNQNIASELQLALGTIKAHVHNILKKTAQPTRQDLMRDFWKD